MKKHNRNSVAGVPHSGGKKEKKKKRRYKDQFAKQNERKIENKSKKNPPQNTLGLPRIPRSRPFAAGEISRVWAASSQAESKVECDLGRFADTNFWIISLEPIAGRQSGRQRQAKNGRPFDERATSSRLHLPFSSQQRRRENGGVVYHIYQIQLKHVFWVDSVRPGLVAAPGRRELGERGRTPCL
jgi:hypothetical protein